MKKVSLLVFALLILCLSSVWAQEEDEDLYYIERDVAEVSFFGGLGIPASGINDWQDSLGAKTGWNIGVEGGYFLTPSIVLGLNFTYVQMSIDTDTQADQLHHRLYNPSLYLKYYFFGESDFVPYFRGQVGLTFGKFATQVLDQGTPKYRELSYDPSLLVGGGLGAFLYTSDYGGLFVEGNFYQGFSEDAEKIYQDTPYTFGENGTLLDIHAGIRVFFGASE